MMQRNAFYTTIDMEVDALGHTRNDLCTMNLID